MYLCKYTIKSKQTRILKNFKKPSRDWSLLQQVDVFPYLKTRCLCVLLYYLNYHWYNSTVKINHLIKFNLLISNYDVTIKLRAGTHH